MDPVFWISRILPAADSETERSITGIRRPPSGKDGCEHLPGCRKEAWKMEAKKTKQQMQEDRNRLMRVCRGDEPADLVLINGRLINVFTDEILEEPIAIADGKIAGIGDYEGKQVVDLQGGYVLPGLIDAHLHIESSMASPSVLSPALLAHGVTSAVVDPHEMVNAAGAAGLDYMLEDAAQAEIDYFFMIPSSVPSCDFEVTGCGTFSAEEMKPYLDSPQVLGLAETMRFGDVIEQEERMQAKLDLFADRVIDGHGPGLKGKALQAYHLAGVANDHEATTGQDAIDRLRAGFWLLIRQGSGAKNLRDLLKALLEKKIPLDRCAFCTDDKHLEDILEEGTIDDCLRQAVALGCSPLQAVRMASLQPAVHYGLKHKGALSAGYDADFLVVRDLKDFEIESVWKDGRPADLSLRAGRVDIPQALRHSVHLPSFTADDLQPVSTSVAMEMVGGQLLTGRKEVFFEVREGETLAQALDRTDLNLLCAMERYGKTGEFACCLLSGFGLKNGAIAASYAHDSHNAIALGDSPEDIALALRTLESADGGFVLVENGTVWKALSLPGAGLISTQCADSLADEIEAMKTKAREMGVPQEIDPFANLSFLSLPVIPELRLVPQGLYEISSRSFLSDR